MRAERSATWTSGDPVSPSCVACSPIMVPFVSVANATTSHLLQVYVYWSHDERTSLAHPGRGVKVRKQAGFSSQYYGPVGVRSAITAATRPGRVGVDGDRQRELALPVQSGAVDRTGTVDQAQGDRFASGSGVAIPGEERKLPLGVQPVRGGKHPASLLDARDPEG